jgi:hypothetical protein
LELLFSPLFSSGDVQCFGEDCYALAFGVPGLLMVVALGKYSGQRKLTITYAYHLKIIMWALYTNYFIQSS